MSERDIFIHSSNNYLLIFLNKLHMIHDNVWNNMLQDGDA